MRYNELVEAFDRPLEYEVLHAQPRSFDATFNSGSSQIAYFAAKTPKGEWNIGFSNRSADIRNRFAMTGDKKSIEVLATIIAITKDFVNRYNPDTIIFFAKSSEGSRVSAYRRLAQKLSALYGYVPAAETTVDGDIKFSVSKVPEAIDESFNTVLPYNIVDQTDDTFRARFDTPKGTSMEVVADEIRGIWYVVFAPEGSDSENEWAMTNDREALVVLSTVSAILKEFVAYYQPEKITFSASKDDKSRANVYDRMLTRLSTGYKFSKREFGHTVKFNMLKIE
jgi:hypothetical protein